MKRIVILMLSICFIFSLSGCSGVKNNSSTVIESSRTETEATATTTTTVTEEEITDTETESEPTEEEKIKTGRK